MSESSKISPESRFIRVFVSSTFRDMNAEREELVKYIFPQLRKICEQRGVIWSEVDLRWGISDEQKAEGLVLPICLAEIERSRPYFIGLLGQRYGWVPDEIPHHLIDAYPWLEEHQTESVTALEIIHGVLNDPEMADHAFFYFRDPAFIETLPKENQPDFLETPTPEEIRTLGAEEAASLADSLTVKLDTLKENIRDSGFPVHENYQDPKELGDLVYQDLKQVIDTLYPENLVPDSRQRERNAHESFALSRFSINKSGIYVERAAYFDQLDQFVHDNGPPLTITGSSGLGKSALIAHWIMKKRGKRSWITHLTQDIDGAIPIIFHFVGATKDSTDWMMMLQHIIGELKDTFDFEIDIPNNPDQLRVAFSVAISKAALKGKVVLVIDAVNQLEDRDGALDLVWLPMNVPPNVRLILSILEGKTLSETQNRGWQILEIKPLNTEERKQFIIGYLGYFGKTLAPHLVDQMAQTPQTANPLYLKTLLDEIRLHGDHFTLEATIQDYLSAGTVDSLYEKILERYERDYTGDVEGVVQNSLSYIWSANKGLSETELLDLLGEPGHPLPRAYWSPFYLAAEQGLINRSGLLSCAHDYFRHAIERRYLSTEQNRVDIHAKLAEYFLTQPMGTRKIDELPWHLSESHSWEQLSHLLADESYFSEAYETNEFDIKKYVGILEREKSFAPPSVFTLPIAHPDQYEDKYLIACSELLQDIGYYCESYELNKHLHDRFVIGDDIQNLHKTLRNQAWILYKTGHPEEAKGLHITLQASCRKNGDSYTLQNSLGNLGLIFFAQGKLKEAMELHKEKEGICRDNGYKESLHASLGNQALILKHWGDIDGALRLHKEEERICRELGDLESLQRSLGNQALLFIIIGKLDKALKLIIESEEISQSINYKDGLQSAYGDHAMILYEMEDFQQAKELLSKQEQITRSTRNLDDLQRCLGNQALILAKEGRFDDALGLHAEEEKISRKLGYKDEIQASLTNQGRIYRSKGELDTALRMFNESEKISREIEKKESLALILMNKGLIYEEKGDNQRAYEQVKEAYEIAQKHGFTQLASKILPIYFHLLDSKEST